MLNIWLKVGGLDWKPVPEERVAGLVLELNGGGYGENDVINSMSTNDDLLHGKQCQFTVRDKTIRLMQSVGYPSHLATSS